MPNISSITSQKEEKKKTFDYSSKCVHCPLETEQSIYINATRYLRKNEIIFALNRFFILIQFSTLREVNSHFMKGAPLEKRLIVVVFSLSKAFALEK